MPFENVPFTGVGGSPTSTGWPVASMNAISVRLAPVVDGDMYAITSRVGHQAGSAAAPGVDRRAIRPSGTETVDSPGQSPASAANTTRRPSGDQLSPPTTFTSTSFR